jgi:glycerol uptake facilitator-like aquaporin
MNYYYQLVRKLTAEFLGTYLLALAVVGSGIMATNLTSDLALALLINACATAAILYLIIHLFKDISGAHFNPLVTLIGASKREISISQALFWIASQISGGVLGVISANAIFGHSAIEISSKIRTGGNLWLSEIIATAGLIFLIYHFASQAREKLIPSGVALWIFGAYFFTSSTAFANPAITLSRIFTESFAGISPMSALKFIPFQIVGAVLGIYISKLLEKDGSKK